MNRAVLRVDPAGTVSGFYTELIPLQSIGLLTMIRATSIEFNEETQEWEVRNRQGGLLHSNRSREECLRWEHREFNQE